MLFTEKYFPQAFEEFIGNPAVLEAVQQWANAWNNKKQQKPLFFYGPCGTGKTALAFLIAKVMGWQLFELNASDFRTKETIEKFAGSASMSSSFFGTLRLILLDEVDGISSKDKGGASAIAEILKNSKNPVILTSTDLYARNISTLRLYCENIQFKKINYLSIEKRLKEICQAEKIHFEDSALKQLAQASNGDLRAALLDLQTLSLFGTITTKNVLELSERLKLEDVFKTLNSIFNSKDLLEIKKIMAESKEDPDLLFNWIFENIPRVLKPKEASLAFDYFSKGDVFEGRILHSQYYGFRRYSFDLMSSASLSKEEHKSAWINYQFPSFLRQMSSSSSDRSLAKIICQKIGEKIHSSGKQVMQYELPLLREMFQNEKKAINLSSTFDFGESEIAFLLDTKPDSKKVSRIYAESQKLKEKSISGKYSLEKGSAMLVTKEKASFRSAMEKTKEKQLSERHHTNQGSNKKLSKSPPEKQTRLFK